ncbi:CHAP domain-containing protein [Moraxella sp. ZJ142]|uniref:CHAP domain-containing protein n=1 Tax=Moraxella marmotae TaxID=3344520 RepID=UPI0035D50C62
MKTTPLLSAVKAGVMAPCLLLASMMSTTAHANTGYERYLSQDNAANHSNDIPDLVGANDIDIAINNLLQRYQATPPPSVVALQNQAPAQNTGFYAPQTPHVGNQQAAVRPFSYFDPVLGKEIVIGGNASVASQLSNHYGNNAQEDGYRAKAYGNLPSGSAPVLAAKSATSAAKGSSTGWCALFVRKALQVAGYKITPQASAYMYNNGALASAGFTKVSKTNYQPQVGDVAVFNRSNKNPHGHIQIYNGTQWVSDFRQPKFSPYTQHNGYTIWRDRNYLNAVDGGRTTLAYNDR